MKRVPLLFSLTWSTLGSGPEARQLAQLSRGLWPRHRILVMILGKMLLHPVVSGRWSEEEGTPASWSKDGVQPLLWEVALLSQTR